jgi:hypothetical protein
MIKLLPLIKEYISNPLIYLKRYLTMSEKDKKHHLVYQHPYLVKSFAKQYFDPQIKKFILNHKGEDYEIVEEFENKFPTEFVDFLDWSGGMVQKLNPIPTWAVMNYQGVIKNQWLIHFTDFAEDIWNVQSFKYGVSNLDDLGYTTSFTHASKKDGGYNFAYDIRDYAKYGRSSYKSGSWKYGSEAVLFKASGIKAYHYGDEEPQVIFVGNTAHDIVYMKYNKTEGDWNIINSKTNKIIYRAQTLPDIVNWTVKNFNQYKKVLLP